MKTIVIYGISLLENKQYNADGFSLLCYLFKYKVTALSNFSVGQNASLRKASP